MLHWFTMLLTALKKTNQTPQEIAKSAFNKCCPFDSIISPRVIPGGTKLYWKAAMTPFQLFDLLSFKTSFKNLVKNVPKSKHSIEYKSFCFYLLTCCWARLNWKTTLLKVRSYFLNIWIVFVFDAMNQTKVLKFQKKMPCS